MRCRTRRLMGPAMLMTVGVLFLLENLHVANLGFHRTWPVILLVIGGVKLLQGNRIGGGTYSAAAGWPRNRREGRFLRRRRFLQFHLFHQFRQLVR